MRKIILSLTFILTLISLSFASSFATFSFMNVAFAQEELTFKEATESSEPSIIRKSVEYSLPYAGLLPDSPLYFLKVSRDAIVGFLISSPLKKADFYLLQADKRLNAGVYLLQTKKNKQSLAESTISKGENYFEKAVSKTQDAKKQGMDIKDIASRLYTASKKHQEVIRDLEKNVDLKTKASLKSLLERVKNFEKQVELLKPK